MTVEERDNNCPTVVFLNCEFKLSSHLFSDITVKNKPQTNNETSHALLLYLVWREAVQRPDWSRVSGLQLAQVGQQRQISLLITALVLPVKQH